MIRVRQIKVLVDNRDNLKKYISKKLKVNEDEIKSYKIVKESIDARKKPDVYLVYEVDVEVSNENRFLNGFSDDVVETPDESFNFVVSGKKKIQDNIVIVGAGPAGLFCAYILASNGYKPLVIERGDVIENRVKKVDDFWKRGILDVNCNVQFGLGGAGTFSDGKLNTLIKDKEFIGKKVFEIFVENGAPKEIMYQNKPHIGTDMLRIVINNMYHKMVNMGVNFLFNHTMTDINVREGIIKSIVLNDSTEIKCDALVLAIGHSARDTFKMLYDHNILIEPKPFAVGVRIEHPQELINISQYGTKYHPYLKNASYKLTYTTSGNRGVYSFCMCPGGYVVNASSEDKRLVVNGMSNYKRDSKNANSAIVVTVGPNDYGDNVFDGIEFQKHLEEQAYKLGNGNIPVQLYEDFVNNVCSTKYGKFQSMTKGNTSFANLNELFPNYILDSLKEAIPYFGKKINGYDREDAILLGVESRTSSPIKIPRNDLGVSSIEGIYPCGEGAGYAGGITTSAIDGIRTAKELAKIYSNKSI